MIHANLGTAFQPIPVLLPSPSLPVARPPSVPLISRASGVDLNRLRFFLLEVFRAASGAREGREEGGKGKQGKCRKEGSKEGRKEGR